VRELTRRERRVYIEFVEPRRSVWDVGLIKETIAWGFKYVFEEEETKCVWHKQHKQIEKKNHISYRVCVVVEF
jgi:hypothetical protein